VDGSGSRAGAALSANVMGWDNHHTQPFPVEHAIGVDSEFIVDVDVAFGVHAQAGNPAVEIVNAMSRKVPRPN
jgi:hypothetical protein